MSKYWQYWNLKTNAKGRQWWEFTAPNAPVSWQSEEGKVFLSELQKAFVFEKKTNPNSADLIYRQKQVIKAKVPAASGIVKAAHTKAISYYESLQADSGHWPADYGGPHFLAPGLVIASYVTQSPLPLPHQALIKQYFLNHQNEDGGWGLHIEDASTMFGTVLQYVALRLLG